MRCGGPRKPPTALELVERRAPAAQGLLAAALARTRPDGHGLRATGADWGRYLAGRPGRRDVATELPRALERLGFHATVTGELVRITGCPCAVGSPDHPEVVCALATGLVDGVLAASGSELRLAEHDNNPEARRCTLRLTAPA